MSVIFTIVVSDLSTCSDCHASSVCMMICVLFALHVQAYANNQHKISEEILTNPFLKAMSICEGTVGILDAGCVVYSRIWCIFELFKSVMGDNINYEFDVYTERDGGSGAVGITHGYIPSDGNNPFVKTERESEFLLDRILQSINVDVKQAKASLETDRKLILNTISGRSIDDPVVDDHDKYDELNNILRGIFVAPALDRIIEEEDVHTITRCLDVFKASNSRIINLDLIYCSRFDDEILIKLADSLPPTLTEFTLSSKGSSVTVYGINAFVGKILGCPQLVRLDLLFNSIDDAGANAIADALKVNRSLETLDLAYNDIGDGGADAIADALNVNHSLKALKLFDNKIGDDGAKAIANALKVNHSLEKLGMSVNIIGDDGAKAIADALKDICSLKTLELNRNEIGDDGAKAIADALSLCLMQENHCLESLYLFSNNISADVKEYLKIKSVNRNRKISIF